MQALDGLAAGAAQGVPDREAGQQAIVASQPDDAGVVVVGVGVIAGQLGLADAHFAGQTGVAEPHRRAAIDFVCHQTTTATLLDTFQ